MGPAGDGHDLRIGGRERGVDASCDLAPALGSTSSSQKSVTRWKFEAPSMRDQA
jgi:hypothetical protein